MSKVRIRMYRQGLGDCFLLTFATGGADTHVLIDCGVLKGTAEAKERMQRVARDVVSVTDGKLDVLVATHEHWDHLSGFLQAGQIFDELEVAEVWLAWTEDPDDDLAEELRARKAKALRAVAAATRKLAESNDEAAKQTAVRLDRLLGFHGEVSNDGRPTTAAALGWVKQRPGAQTRFLRPGEQLAGREGIPGVRTYVLGPPHDARLIKRSDPSKKHSEVYELAEEAGIERGFYAAVTSLADGADPSEQPFGAWYGMSEEEARAEDFGQRYYGSDEAWRLIDEDWLGAAGPLALHLDSDTNNTSLALAFELFPGGDVLLFPGDAQVGNWVSWKSLEWLVRDGDETRTLGSSDLLARTVLYKVGHHASHNATLREEGLELMSSGDLAAMIPVNRETAKKMGWKMPFPPLLRRLDEQTKGRLLDAELGGIGERRDKLRAGQLERFEARTEVREGWIDYTIEW